MHTEYLKYFLCFFSKYLPAVSLTALHWTAVADSSGDSTHIAGCSGACFWVPYSSV